MVFVSVGILTFRCSVYTQEQHVFDLHSVTCMICVFTVLYSSSRRVIVRNRCILTPFSISSLTNSTRSITNASNIACSREPTYTHTHTLTLRESHLNQTHRTFIHCAAKLKETVHPKTLAKEDIKKRFRVFVHIIKVNGMLGSNVYIPLKKERKSFRFEGHAGE